MSSACSILYICNSKYQFLFQTADDCLGKEEVLVHLKSHRERKPLKLLSCVNGCGICNHSPPRDSNEISVIPRSPAFPKRGKSDVAISGSGIKPAYGYDIGVQKTLLLWFSGGLPQMLEETVTRRYGILWLPIRKKEVLGLVNKTYPHVF